MLKSRTRYKGSHPKTLFEHGQNLSGGIVQARDWNGRVWRYKVLLRAGYVKEY